MKHWFTDESTKPLAIAATVCAVLLVFCCVWFALMPTTAKPTETLYPMTTKVVKLDHENDVVTCEDFNGFLWQFEGCEDWQEGDICSMIMNDNGTSKIFDDEIVSIKYDGYFKG
jgi:hypothetical protein